MLAKFRCHTGIQQCVDDAGVALFHLGWNCQLPILPDTFGKPAHCRCSLANALIELGVDRQVVTDRGPKVRELLVYHFKFIILSVKMTGGVSTSWLCALVLFRLMVSSKYLQVWENLSMRHCTCCTVCEITAASSAKRISLIRVLGTLALAVSLAMLKSLPSD